MSFKLERDVAFALAQTWDGPVSALEFSFSFIFPSGVFGGSAIAELETYLKAALFSASIIPEIRGSYLGYTIERDTAPRIDRYRVKVFLAGETEESSGKVGPFFFGGLAQTVPHVFPALGLIAIVIAIGIAGIFAVIAYRIYNLGGAGIIGLSLGIVAIGAGLGLLVLGARRKPGRVSG